jgi:very-short-patch-repair endonuclease
MDVSVPHVAPPPSVSASPAARQPAESPNLGAANVQIEKLPPMRASTPKRGVACRVWAPEPVEGTGDHEVARVAGAQRGVITATQLAAAGLSRHAVAHRLRTGRLHRLSTGIYLVGRASLEPLAAETAVVLSFDGDAVVSHASAAAVWGLIESPPALVTVTLVGCPGRTRPRALVHHTSDLDPRDVRFCRGLPVTAPARTLLDFASITPDGELERAVAEARVQRLLRPGDLEDVLQRTPRRKGSRRLRAMLAAERDPAFTRRAAERRLLGLLRASQLPDPVVNGRVLGHEVDFHWPAQRLVVETDGHQFHGHRRAFERDRRRDQQLVAAGWRVMRITWRQLTTEPLAVLARLAMALAPRADAA